MGRAPVAADYVVALEHCLYTPMIFGLETYSVPRIMKAGEPMEFLEHETPAPFLKITDDEEKGVWKGINWLSFGPPKLNVWGNREFCHRFSNDGLGSIKLAEEWGPPYLLTILLDACS